MPFAIILVELDVVARAEHDDVVGIFGHGAMESTEARQWWAVQRGTKGVEGMQLEELEGFTEIEQKYLESMTPERRLPGLAPERRLAGLAADEQLLALSDDVLRSLPDSFIDGLPPPVRARIHARLGR